MKMKTHLQIWEPRFLKLFNLLFWVGGIALVINTPSQGQDFAVYWKVARMALEGEPVYSVARDGAMVYKYPPWTVPFFFLYAPFPLLFAKWLWGLTQVGALFFTARFLLREGLNRWVVFIGLCVFYGIWAVHALDGQVNLIILALTLWGIQSFSERKPIRGAVLMGALSWKIFTGFGIFGVNWKNEGRALLKSTFAAVLLFSFLSLPALFGSDEKTPLHLVQTWFEAAASGGSQFEGGQVRNRENQGFPALVLRLLGVPASETDKDIYAFLFVAALIGGFAFYGRRFLTSKENWILWIGFIPAVHPLSWFHTFVFAFPLAVYAVDRSIRSQRSSWIALSVFGAILIAAVTQKTFGEWGHRLELLSVKSWGVFLCAIALFLSRVDSKSNQKAEALG